MAPKPRTCAQDRCQKCFENYQLYVVSPTKNMNKELMYYFHEVDSKYQGFYCVNETFW